MKGEKNIKLVTHDGRTQCKAAWARELGMSREAFHQRFKRYNGDMTQICAIPLRTSRKHMYKGKRLTVHEIAELSGLSESGVYKRFGTGMSVAQVIETPRKSYIARTTAGLKQKPLGCTYPDCDKCPYSDCAW